MKPIDYAKAAIETMMRTYTAEDLPPKGGFHYHQGVFLSGVHKTWKICGEDRYFNYMKAWIDSVFDEDGKIIKAISGELDDIQPGILLFPIFDKTKNEYYKRCLNSVYRSVCDIPRNSEGGLWHKVNLEDQMWLDGLYMAGPFCAEYAERFGLTEMSADVVRQALLMKQKTMDEDTGLMYHAWDGSGKAKWRDPQTGRAPEFWGRAMGWVPVALLDDLDHLPKDIEGRESVIHMCTDLLKSLCKYQSEDGRWYQVVNKGTEPGNWLENSCSCLYVAAICKAVRNGYLSEAYRDAAVKGYEGVIRSLGWKGDDIQIGYVCVGTGVSDYKYYCERPISTNDLHGVGAFLLMCSEMYMLGN